MKRRMIKRYPGLTFIEIYGRYVRKDCIEWVDETVPGEITITTIDQWKIRLTKKQAKPILEELGFNV